MYSTRRGPRDHPSVNPRPLGRAEMSGGKEPGGPTYVTDGLTSGATGPSPEHRGAPRREGCDAEWEGATRVGMWGPSRMKKQLASHVRMLNFLFGPLQEAPSKVREANEKQGSIRELLPGTVNGPCWCCSGGPSTESPATPGWVGRVGKWPEYTYRSGSRFSHLSAR
ncbi:hypothetical protein FA13DRAFT_1713823 [Coprinellus micaceus]|uniref:Uncharacterized protein n=1 Tax=Coprinellus micaceus TaxID=71717 RepID=A0A4Y7SUM3_COPMI|nr:hypothetical protein FA13DRAFT_1713823 [Coprinellus micaceus]